MGTLALKARQLFFVKATNKCHNYIFRGGAHGVFLNLKLINFRI